MPTKGSDAAAKAQEATYKHNAAQAKLQSKRSIDQMFEAVQDFSTTGTSNLSSATAQLGKYGYIDKNQYHTSGATSNYGRTNLATDTAGVAELEKITDRIHELRELLPESQGGYTKEETGEDLTAADLAQSNADARQGGNVNVKFKDEKEELEKLQDQVKSASEVDKYIADKGGLEAIQGVATSKGAQRAMGSSLDALMKAKSSLVRDRSKLINMGIMSSYDAAMQGKHFQQAAKYAEEAASYARAQARWNNFMSVTSSALNIISLGMK